MKVSIIIPAFNAAETVGETLDSVIAQTYEGWEAIVVDDGSQDATNLIVAAYARDEPRIHLVQQANAGVCAARNRGTAEADGELLLFLDADDLILETHLAVLVDRFVAQPEIGAAYSGWARLSAEGEPVEGVQWPEPEDAFQAFAHHSLFPVHSCMVRCELVNAVGGWDSSFVTCEDWDLWLRVARMGVHFAAVPDVTALYRMRTESASLDGIQMLRDGLRVLSLASRRDPRVPEPDARYAEGLPEDRFRAQRVYFLVWCAGLELGQKREATRLVQELDTWGGVELRPRDIADSLKESIPTAAAVGPDRWPSLLPERLQAIDRFLFLLEERTGMAGLHGAVWNQLEEAIFARFVGTAPVFMHKTMALALDAEQPIVDIEGRSGLERVICGVSMGRHAMGALQLPVVDGVVTAYVLQDAIAAELAWPIFEQFVRETLIDSLDIRTRGTRTSIWRGELCLMQDVDMARDWRAALFQEAGWALFLQEVWGRAEWPTERFHHPNGDERRERRTIADSGNRVVAEVSEPLPDLTTKRAEIEVLVTVGGVPIGMVRAPSKRGVVSAQALGAAITRSAGFELCRVAVREGLLGQPLGGEETLRERLAIAAARRRRLGVDTRPLALVDDGQDLRGEGATAVLGRASPEVIDAPQARRAALPVASLEDFKRAGDLFDQELRVEGKEPVGRLFYGPEVISRRIDKGQTEEASPEGAATSWSPLVGRRSLEHAVQFLRGSERLRRLLGRRAANVARKWAWSVPRDLPGSQTGEYHKEVVSGFSERGETAQLPILMYHRIADETPEPLAPYTVTPAKFEEQLSFLRDAGYYSVTLETWRAARFQRRPLPGKALLITFDDGYEDFAAAAWPRLKQFGFNATLFLVAGEMGGESRWDRGAGATFPLLSWDDVRRLRDEGLHIGAHSMTHKRLATLSPSESVREIIRSRIVLKQELGAAVTAFAYPYGSVNAVIRHLAGACGFTFGLTCETRHAAMGDSLLGLPRIEVRGDDDLEAFARKLQAA